MMALLRVAILLAIYITCKAHKSTAFPASGVSGMGCQHWKTELSSESPVHGGVWMNIPIANTLDLDLEIKGVYSRASAQLVMLQDQPGLDSLVLNLSIPESQTFSISGHTQLTITGPNVESILLAASEGLAMVALKIKADASVTLQGMMEATCTEDHDDTGNEQPSLLHSGTAALLKGLEQLHFMVLRAWAKSGKDCRASSFQRALKGSLTTSQLPGDQVQVLGEISCFGEGAAGAEQALYRSQQQLQSMEWEWGGDMEEDSGGFQCFLPQAQKVYFVPQGCKKVQERLQAHCGLSPQSIALASGFLYSANSQPEAGFGEGYAMCLPETCDPCDVESLSGADEIFKWPEFGVFEDEPRCPTTGLDMEYIVPPGCDNFAYKALSTCGLDWEDLSSPDYIADIALLGPWDSVCLPKGCEPCRDDPSSPEPASKENLPQPLDGANREAAEASNS